MTKGHMTLREPLQSIYMMVETWISSSVYGCLDIKEREVDLLFFDQETLDISLKITNDKNTGWSNHKNEITGENDIYSPNACKVNFKLIKE